MKKIISKLIDVVSIIIGICAIIISVYYSTKWFLYIGMSMWLAVTISIIYIVFVNMVFESSILFFKRSGKYSAYFAKLKAYNKGLYREAIYKSVKNKITGSFIFIIWLILVSYSMVSTIAGQYNQLIKVENSRKNNYSDKNNYETDNKNIEIKIDMLKKDNEVLQKELEALLKRVSTVEDIEKRHKYKNTTNYSENRIDKLRKELKNNKEQINKLLDNKSKLVKNNYTGFTVNSGNVYEYFSKLFKLNPLLIQFILSIFPSIFIDIIAPISIAIFLYRKREKEPVK